MPRIKVDIGGWHARPEHCVALLVLSVFLVRPPLQRGVRKFSLAATDRWVAAYLLWSYVSSALMSPDPRLTLRWALLTNFAVLPYFLIQVFIADHRMLSWTFRAFLSVGVIECAYAVVCFTSRQLFGTGFGVEVGQYSLSGLGGIYGTQYEPNILGSYSACLAVMLLVLAFLTPHRTNWAAGGTIIAFASVLVSLSRAAVLSFVFTSFILLLFGIRSGVVKMKKLLPICLVLAIFIAPIAAMSGKNLVDRFANLSGDTIQTDMETVGRLLSVTLALDDIWQHPVAGNGTASFGLLAGARLGDGAWIANSAVRVVHDTGIVGLFLFAAILYSLGKHIKKVIRGSARERNIVIVLLAGCLVYAIAFMSADGTMLSFFWVHLGLLSSACSLATEHVSEF
ncbi:MAG: O-antigen ligase family protein [Candidatus Acidiferrum sp.]